MLSLQFMCVFGLLFTSFAALLPQVRNFHTTRDISQTLFISDPYHDAGEWGIIDMCEDGSFVTGIEVKYNPESNLDETAVNGIKLYCSTFADFHDTGYITSSIGTHGDWFGITTCATNFVTGFRANVLKYQGAFTDDVAVEDFKANCDYGTEVIDGLPWEIPHKMKLYNNVATQNFKNGTWSNWATCNAGSAVCGIQTRYEDGSIGDETAICDMVLFCCNEA